ncbi:P-loop ATPase, Sll1717 family [Aeromonas veronii]|uniref:P-loop ATPase, Sll1717 family n=1 Tax=Aeromonas veronii TaxID=654 RepID=UPI003BA23413
MIKVNDRRLWGNEAADDEDPELLNSYFVTQNEWDEFFDQTTPLSIARARKGMGKSALLRECAYRLADSSDSVAISIKGSDLVAQKQFSSTTPIEQIYDWQQRICAIINRHLGASIGIALSDDKITLVESAELSGFKSRNLVGLLVDRLKGKLGSVDLQKISCADDKALLSRVSKSENFKVVLLVDDIDATFNNSPEECLRLSTFFSACRGIASNFKGISIRTVIRSDVWASIRKTDEALDKVEQYIFDISWSKKEFRSFLSERVIAYCKHIGAEELISGKKKEEIISLVFEPHFPWGKGSAYPHRVIHVYSGGRPRWAAQLCRLAGQETVRTGTSKVIKFGSIKQVLESYGRFRLDDVSREHRHQCEAITDIVNAFSKQPSVFTTHSLISFIDSKILSNMSIQIDSNPVNTALDVARFLFRIGFILGYDREESGNPEYYQFEEKPDLLKNYANLDSGMRWIVHPSFHTALSLTTR